MLVPAPTDWDVERFCGVGVAMLATSSLLRPRLRFRRLLAMPELRLDQRPLTLWPMVAPMPLTLADMVFFVYGRA